jgi:hypothetical protein
MDADRNILDKGKKRLYIKEILMKIHMDKHIKGVMPYHKCLTFSYFEAT